MSRYEAGTDGNEDETRDGHVTRGEHEYGQERSTDRNDGHEQLVEHLPQKYEEGRNRTRTETMSTDGNENEARDEQVARPNTSTDGNEHEARDRYVAADEHVLQTESGTKQGTDT